MQDKPVIADLDSTEPMIIVTWLLPYKLSESTSSPGTFKLTECYSNPTMLYASLQN